MRISPTIPKKDWTKWTEWYAWYPIKIDGAWVWLESVEARCEYCTYDNFWSYRLL